MKVSGSAQYDPADPSKDSVEITIDASSVDTRVQMRDNDLRSPNFLDVQKYPTITFKSKQVKLAGAEKLQMVGDLTIHGVTKEVVLDVKGYTRGTQFRDVSFALHRGEILGVTGLLDSGRNELARALAGVAPAESGTVTLEGKRVVLRTPSDAKDHRIGYVPEDRLNEGLFLDRPIRESLSIVALDSVRRHRRAGWLDKSRERRMTEELASKVRLVARGGLGADGGSLSGGNQQKIVLGKWLVKPPRVIILDEPTRGIDVGAKAEIHRLLVDLARAGSSILLISSEMEEVLGLSHRVGVMHDGRLAGVLDRTQATRETVIRLATGGGQ